MLQCIAGVLGPCILPQKILREHVFNVFFEFLNKEYKVLFQKSEVNIHQDLLDRMTYANMLDSEANRGHRIAARIKMSNFLDVFKKADSLNQAPKIADLQNLFLN